MTKQTKSTKSRSRKVAPPQSRGSASPADLAALVERVVAIIEEAQTRVARAVNSAAVLAAWHVGREIVEFVQGGSARAEYGEQVIEDLSRRIQPRVGRSATRLGAPEEGTAHIRHTRSAKSSTARAKPAGAGFSSRLSWSHYRTLTKVDDAVARAFYEVEAASEGWSVDHLDRQIHTQLHLRLRKSHDKEGVMDLARRGQVVERPIDALKDPVVMDLFSLPQSELLRESDLETAIISKLSQFLLELGKGFAFVARQKRLTFEDEGVDCRGLRRGFRR